jgi:WD40 repeat protein
MIENQPTSHHMASASTKKNVSKGYTNLLFNSTKTLLYANCMNNFLYEFNFVTYNSNHTRSINHKLNNKSTATYHINTSNFIRSSLSKCDNFLLTGSSDFNAYIYPTSVNNQFCHRFKKSMPAIVLKGHTNEVTAVKWNPLDSNQLVTCSDDNTIRIWNVKREIDDLTTKECNYSSASVLNEFESVEEPSTNEATKCKEQVEDEEQISEDYDDLMNYSSKIRFNNRIYNKYRPHITGVYDDYLFINYEYKNFMRNPVNKTLTDRFNSNSDVENDLCLKWKQISIDKPDDVAENVASCSPDSPTSVNLNSIEENLKR